MTTANIDALKDRDYYILIDRSGSMTGTDTPTKQSRWDYVRESATAIANKLNEYDPDGITVVPFAGSYELFANTTPDKVGKIFESEPMGGTILAPALNAVFKDYLANKKAGTAKANGAIAVVITDGEPSDEGDVARSIVNFTKNLQDGRTEFGIEFFQVGRDVKATKFLQRLDDNLTSEGAKYDIVDTKTIDEVEKIGLTEAVMASLTD